MAKIEKIEKIAFQPYKLIIENQDEHEFLKGLLNASDQLPKRKCNNYDEEINVRFFSLISDAIY